MKDYLPRTQMNQCAKIYAAGFILGGEICNRTNTQKQTNKQKATDISTPCLSAGVDDEYANNQCTHKISSREILR